MPAVVRISLAGSVRMRSQSPSWRRGSRTASGSFDLRLNRPWDRVFQQESACELAGGPFTPGRPEPEPVSQRGRSSASRPTATETVRPRKELVGGHTVDDPLIGDPGSVGRSNPKLEKLE